MSNKLNFDFENLLSEGVHDKGIFKAVFLTGGPGSGKDYVLNNVLHNHGLTEIDDERLHSFFNTNSHNFKSDEPDENSPLLKKAKNVNDLRHVLAIHGRNGLIVNGTGDDHHKTKFIKSNLEKLGYDTSMLHVHADDEVSKQRHIERVKRGARVVPETKRKEKWDNVQVSRNRHAKMFGDNYHEFDNSLDLRNATPELVKSKKEELAELHGHFSDFINSVPENEKSTKWIDKKTNEPSSVSSKGTKKLPHKESLAYQTAQENGLTYYGSGKYGKSGKVTHHTINDNLVEIKKDEKKIKESVHKSFFGFKNLLKESIDKGIEPGISMAGSGENLSRKNTGTRKKSCDLEKLEELTGDETGESISSQKEDELNKVGIQKIRIKSKNTIG